jgi:hypothetical protein
MSHNWISSVNPLDTVELEEERFKATTAAFSTTAKVTVTNAGPAGTVTFYGVPSVGNVALNPNESRELTLTLPGDTLVFFSHREKTATEPIAVFKKIVPTAGMIYTLTTRYNQWDASASVPAPTNATPAAAKVKLTNANAAGMVNFYGVPTLDSLTLSPGQSQELILTLPRDTLMFFSHYENGPGGRVLVFKTINPAAGQAYALRFVDGQWTATAIDGIVPTR